MKRAFLWIIISMLMLTAVSAHSGDDEAVHHMDINDMPMMQQEEIQVMHYGSIQFPAWTYYVEIVQHILSIAAAVAGVVIIYSRLYKTHGHLKKVLDYAVWGFLILGIGELLTTLHHFLFHPFGIMNAIINHLMVLVGLGLIVYSFFILRKH